MILVFVFAIILFLLPLKHSFLLNIILANCLILVEGNDISSIITCVLFIKFLIVTKFKFSLNPYSRFLIGFVFVIVISNLFYGGVNSSLYFNSYLLLLMTITMLTNIFDKNDIILFFRYFLFGFLILSIHLILQIFSIHPFVDTNYIGIRLVPMGFSNQEVNSNHFSLILLTFYSLFFVLHQYLFKLKQLKNNYTLLSFVFSITTFLILFQLGSRAGLACMVLCFLFFYLKIPLKNTLTYVGLFTLILLFNFSDISLTSIFSKFEDNAALIRSIEINELDQYNSLSRQNLAKVGWNIFLENIFFGVGTGNEYIYFIKKGVNSTSHNTIISLLCQYGLVGLVLVIYFFKTSFQFFNRPIFFRFFIILVFFATVHNVLLISIFWVVIVICSKFDLSLNNVSQEDIKKDH